MTVEWIIRGKNSMDERNINVCVVLTGWGKDPYKRQTGVEPCNTDNRPCVSQLLCERIEDKH